MVGSPCSPRDSQESSPTRQFKSINSSALSLLYGPTLTSIHDYWRNHNFDYMDLCQQNISLLLNMLSRLVIAFLPRSKCLSISWLQSPSAVILKPKKIKSAHCFHWEPGSCPISPWKPGLFETDLLQKVLVYRNPFLPEGFSGWNVPSVREGGVIQNSAFSRQWLSL